MPELTTPIGRMIGGSLYKMFPRTDDNGNPIINRDGTPSEAMSFGVAIAKGGEKHWNETVWGKQIFDAAVAAWPRGECQMPAFSWKILDGDSAVPNKNMKKPCEQPGYAGNWVIWFNQSWFPTICNQDGTKLITEENAVLPGYWVQVVVDFKSNGAKHPKTPGMYLNPRAVALTAYDTIIETSATVDVSKAGFGGQPLPPGASATPIAQMPPMPPQQQGQAPSPPMPPKPDFAAGPPAPPAGPQVVPGSQYTWEQLVSAGWTEETARANGLIV